MTDEEKRRRVLERGRAAERLLANEDLRFFTQEAREDLIQAVLKADDPRGDLVKRRHNHLHGIKRLRKKLRDAVTMMKHEEKQR